MDNPWVTCAADLDQRPYVLEADNRVLSRDFPDARKTLDLDRLPMPFAGPAAAPVVLLSLIPSLLTNEAELGAPFADERRRALHGEGDSTGWWLSRKWATTKDGHAYWASRLRDLREEVYPDRDEASGLEALARQLLLVEFFPYPSNDANAVRRIKSLPSQQYGFHLVRRAVAERRLIVILVSVTLWREAVGELNDPGVDVVLPLHHRPQQFISSPKHVTEEDFGRIVERLRR